MTKGRLIKNSDLTPQERRERASKAGKASVEARRQKKALKELLDIALAMPSGEGTETNAETIVASLIRSAIEGDVKAFIEIRDTIGEKPVNKIEVGLADSVAEQITDIDV